MHSTLVMGQSSVLNKLVSGDFKEAEDGQVVLEAVDEQTFIRFSHFAYTADYEEACSATQGLISPEPEEQQEREERETYLGSDLSREEIAIPAFRNRDKNKGRTSSCYNCGFRMDQVQAKQEAGPSKYDQWDAFKNAQYIDSRPFRTYTPRQNRSRDEVYTEIFLSHARLYTFADCYSISALMELAIHKLHKTLVSFRLFEERVFDVVELVRYCFKHDVPDTLKKLVIEYVSCHIEKLWSNNDLQQLVGESGELSVGLVESMLPRLD